MSSGNIYERLFRLWASVTKLILDGKRDPETVAEALQVIVDDSKLVRAEPAEKFALLVDLGVITVPDDYDHATALARFAKTNRKKFYDYNTNINDQNFSKPSRILKAGDKLRVCAFKQIVSGRTTSEERLAFLAKQGAIHTGAQGAALVFNQKRNQLPKGFWYASIDDKERLWEDAKGYHRVPSVLAYSNGGFYFNLVSFEGTCYGFEAFLCFRDLSAEARVEVGAK